MAVARGIGMLLILAGAVMWMAPLLSRGRLLNVTMPDAAPLWKWQRRIGPRVLGIGLALVVISLL